MYGTRVDSCYAGSSMSGLEAARMHEIMIGRDVSHFMKERIHDKHSHRRGRQWCRAADPAG